jgi:hypothetical protein
VSAKQAPAAKQPGVAPAGSNKWVSEDRTVEIVSTEMLFCDATDLGTDLLAAMGQAAGAWMAGGTPGAAGAGLLVRGEAMQMIAAQVSSGRLTSYMARLLATTTMIVRGDNAGVHHLKDREALNRAFTGRQKYIFPAVKLALEVSLGGFLDGAKLIGIKIPTMTTDPSLSEDSDQNTSDTA